MNARVRVCVCYVVINLFLDMFVIYLNTFVSFCICFTLNFHTFNLNFIHLRVTLVVCF